FVPGYLPPTLPGGNQLGPRGHFCGYTVCLHLGDCLSQLLLPPAPIPGKKECLALPRRVLHTVYADPGIACCSHPVPCRWICVPRNVFLLEPVHRTDRRSHALYCSVYRHASVRGRVVRVGIAKEGG